jgi:DNA-binding PadR family transcriptional regulator
MVAAKAVTQLGYTLLGLVLAKPQSGYALRKAFETTPLGNYSSSPGSIYPALKALEKAGLVERCSAADGGGKRLFAATSAGEALFREWLARPVDETAMDRHLDGVLLRFAFLQFHPDPRVTLDFLMSFEAAAQARARSLEAFLDGETGQALPLQGRLAVGHGLESIRCSARWAAKARRKLIESGQEEGES